MGSEREWRWRQSLLKLVALTAILFVLSSAISCQKQKAAEGPSKPAPALIISSARILPETPNKETELSLLVQTEGAGGESVQYEYQWIKNGEEMPAENRGALPPGTLRKGDLVQVRVTPRTEKAAGTPFLAPPVRIGNSLPILQEISIEPRMADAKSPLKATVKGYDRDGDFVYYLFQWERNGTPLPDERAETLEPGRFKKGDSITVTVTPDDREALGLPKRSDRVLIGNSPPTIVSSPPVRIQGNLYTYAVRVDDPDDDPVTFAIKTGPKGMTIDPKTGLIQWEIQKGNTGTHSVEVEASDEAGAKSVQQFMLSVEVR